MKANENTTQSRINPAIWEAREMRDALANRNISEVYRQLRNR